MVKLEAYSVSLLGEIKYIGITIQGIRVRWLSHCSAARNSKNRALPRAIRKYGPKAFVVEHIASAKTREDLMALEVLLIKQWNTLAPQGYNLTGGGDGCFAPSDETRRKISISGTGRKPNGTTRQKMSAWQIGKPMSQETREKIRLAKSGNTRSPESRSKQSATLKNCPELIARLAKFSLAIKGTKRSMEVRAKISAGARRRYAQSPFGQLSFL